MLVFRSAYVLVDLQHLQPTNAAATRSLPVLCLENDCCLIGLRLCFLLILHSPC